MKGKPPQIAAERFAKKVEQNERGCLIWRGQLNQDGYGVFRVGSVLDGSRRKVLAHRFSYEQWRGAIPPNANVSHICGDHACVNPDHLTTENDEGTRSGTAAAIIALSKQVINTPQPEAVEHPCSVPSCGKPRVARGWCTGHYQQATKEGRRPPKRTIEESFWLKVDKTGPNGCWLWTGARSTAGYGSFASDPRAKQAHRLAYLYVKGELPELPLEFDHLCRNKLCVNPEHLEPVTRSENMLRAFAARRSRMSG